MFVATLAVLAGVLGAAAYYWRRQRELKRPRLPTHKALAKEFDCFLSCAPLSPGCGATAVPSAGASARPRRASQQVLQLTGQAVAATVQRFSSAAATQLVTFIPARAAASASPFSAAVFSAAAFSAAVA